MADEASNQPTSTSQAVSPSPSVSLNQHCPSSSQTPRLSPQRPGELIMKSNDPSTEALREWARDKEKQYPGANGSIAVTNYNMEAMAWGSAHIIPRKGDTPLPPDERVRHGEVKYVGPIEEGKLGEGEAHEVGQKNKRLSGLFHRKEKEHREEDVVGGWPG